MHRHRKSLTWPGRIRERTHRLRRLRREANKQRVKSLVSDLRHEILDVGPGQTFKRDVAKRSIFCYTWTSYLFKRKQHAMIR